MSRLRQIGDQMLDRLLGTRTAGACVSNVGDSCGCRNHYHYYVSCTGPCIRNGRC